MCIEVVFDFVKKFILSSKANLVIPIEIFLTVTSYQEKRKLIYFLKK